MKEQLLQKVEYFSLFIGIIILTVIVGFFVTRFFKRLIKKSTTELQNDPTNYLFLRHAVTALIYIVGCSIAIYTMPSLRTLASSLLAGAGILAVAIGFASQHALSNIISGVFIVIFKPFRVNDRIKLRDMIGIIEDITLRHTVIRDFNNRRIVVPNTLISEEIIVNSDFGDDKICKRIEIGISYDSDLKKAKKIFQEEILKHPYHIDARTEQQKINGEDIAMVKVISLGDSSVNIRGWAWAKNSEEAFDMECDLIESVKLRFDAEGIEIPFPHRTLVYKNKKNDEAV